jgi:hypothetical protein
MRQGHDKKKSSRELGEKNQTNAGRVSQYTSPLQRNVSQFSQAIGSQANHFVLRFSRKSPDKRRQQPFWLTQ